MVPLVPAEPVWSAKKSAWDWDETAKAKNGEFDGIRQYKPCFFLLEGKVSIQAFNHKKDGIRFTWNVQTFQPGGWTGAGYL